MKHRRSPVVAPFLLALLPLAACSSGRDGGNQNPGAMDPDGSRAATESALDNLSARSSEGLQNAQADLEEAVALDSDNHGAAFLLALVQVAAFLDAGADETSGELGALLADLGLDVEEDGFLDAADDDDSGDGFPKLAGRSLEDLEDPPTSGDVQRVVGILADLLKASAELLEGLPADFTFPFEIDLGDDGVRTVEVDAGDARILAFVLRQQQIELLPWILFDLNADVGALADWDEDGLDAPYRLYNGDAPDDIVQGKTVTMETAFFGTVERRAFLNEADRTGSANTFEPALDADERFRDLRDALAASIDDVLFVSQFVDDGDPSDDLIAIDPADRDCLALGLTALLEDLAAALAGDDPVVDAHQVIDPSCDLEVDSQAFVLRADLFFDPATWSGRVFLPELPGQQVVADEGSFSAALDATALDQVVTDLGGDPLTGEDVLAFWEALDAAWEQASFELLVPDDGFGE